MKIPGLPLPWRKERIAKDWDDTRADPTVGLLDLYAAGPLSPNETDLDRGRAAVRTAFIEARLERSATSDAARPRSRRRMRVLVAACSVAALTLSSAGVVAAESGPGEPFYRTRLTVEAWFLPRSGSDARLEADLGRARARLDEATGAASAANWNGEADAMGAYCEVVASISLPSDPAAQEQVRRRLGQQLAGLQGLRAGAHGSAAGEVGRAIDSVSALLARMGPGPDHGPMTPSGSSGQGPSAAPSQASGSTSGNGGPGNGGSGAGPSGGGQGGQKPGAS